MTLIAISPTSTGFRWTNDGRVVSAGCEKRLWAAPEDTVCNNLHDLPSV